MADLAVAPLDNHNLKSLLDSHDNFLFDCDGVLWHGDTLIPGAAEALGLLKSKGKSIFYVTNNSTATRAQYAVKCRKLGLSADENEIVCTAHSAALHLQDLLRPTANYRPKVYLMGSAAVQEELNNMGMDCIGLGADVVQEDFTQNSWGTVTLEDDIKAVVVAFDKHISFLKILKAASYLRDPKVHFVATNTDQSFPTTSDRISVPGTGCIVAPVAMAADREPVVIGKPETLMVDYLQKEFNLDIKKSVFVGDRLNTDIWLANKCGMTSLFALSGVSTLKEAQRFLESSLAADRLLIPNLYMEDVGVLQRLLESL